MVTRLSCSIWGECFHPALSYYRFSRSTCMNPPATELITALNGVPPGRALDLACGAGRHAIWLRDQGWQVTAVDHEIQDISGVTCYGADLEKHEFAIEPQAWDLIVCWLYWQQDLLPHIAAGLRPGGIVALAGKTEGR